jgi:hypothetical protein
MGRAYDRCRCKLACMIQKTLAAAFSLCVLALLAYVLLHANLGSLFTWDEVARNLVDDDLVLRLDAAGAGLSGLIPTGTSARGVMPEEVLEALQYPADLRWYVWVTEQLAGYSMQPGCVDIQP